MSLLIHNYSLLCMEKLSVCSLCATAVLEALFLGKTAPSKVSTAFCLSRSSACEYLEVVMMEACPKRDCITVSGTLFSSNRVAKVWRRE